MVRISLAALAVFSFELSSMSTSWFLSAQEAFHNRLADSTITLINRYIKYDSNYYTMKYPNGDVLPDRGVCADVVIRAYRKLDIDLQKEVHEDMKRNFALYPRKWGLRSTDRNIDHRRVPNLMKFFERKNAHLIVIEDPLNYRPGDIVCWTLKNGQPHIGIVVNKKSVDGQRDLIVHNVGGGQVLDDCLFRYKIIGHYRYKK